MNLILSTLVRSSMRSSTCQTRFYFSDILKDKDKGEEAIYFTKEDQKLMKKLTKKMKELNKVTATCAGSDAEDRQDLKVSILKRYRIEEQDGLIEEIVRWKRND